MSGGLDRVQAAWIGHIRFNFGLKVELSDLRWYCLNERVRENDLRPYGPTWLQTLCR